MYTVLCAFDDRENARRSMTRLIASGVPRDDVHIQSDATAYDDLRGEPEDGAGRPWWSHAARFAARLATSHPMPGAEGTDRDALRQGGTVLVIHVADAGKALDVGAFMAASGAFDVEHRPPPTS